MTSASRADTGFFKNLPRRCALAIGVALALPPAGAFAQDFLRGSSTPSYSRWQGVYLGATLNESYTNANFDSGTSDLVAFILRNTVLESAGNVSQWNTTAPATAHMQGFGAFIGYNYQVAPDLVLGVEANYTKLSGNSMTSSDTESRSFDEGNGYIGNATVISNITASMRDYATLRGRAGYVMGQFLPYGFIGAAVARGTVDRFVSVFATETPTGGGAVLSLNPNPTIMTDHANFTTWGGVAGLGIEVAILPNMFLRAEYEFAQFGEVAGTRLKMQTGRVGVGFKF